MKRIGICTLNEACNMGAILQAFVMQEVLKNAGYNPEFLRIKDNIVHEKEIIEEFLEMKKCLNISKEYYNYNNKYDAIIVGSDEIWNLNNPTFEHIDEFWGYNLNAQKIIAYAPGASGTNSKIFEKYYNGTKNLNNFTHLSARDTNALDIIKKIAKKDAPIVLDPTLLLNSYEQYIEHCNEKDFILVYGWFFREEEKKEIIRFANEKNLKLYSVGFKLDWCDEFIGSNIFKFLGYMNNATYVVLSQTFHGILFSIIFNKQFIVYTHGNFKSLEILKRAGLESRNCDKAVEIRKKLNNNINYTQTNNWLKKEREKSIRYLMDAIED